MKIRQLADAAIVAALLLTSIPAAELPPADTPEPIPCIVPAEPDASENPAARKPS